MMATPTTVDNRNRIPKRMDVNEVVLPIDDRDCIGFGGVWAERPVEALFLGARCAIWLMALFSKEANNLRDHCTAIHFLPIPKP